MRRLACLFLPLGLCFVCSQACYGATEILVQIQTDVPCSTVRKTGISLRATGIATSLADASVVAESATCIDGAAGQPNDLGTIVFVPSSQTPQLSIRVVLGVDRPTNDCDAVSSTGCITADRQLTYEKHETLRLPVRLDGACTGRVCGKGQTCSAGLCVTSAARCTGETCGSVERDDAAAPPVQTPPVMDLTDAGDAGGLLPDAGVCRLPLGDTSCGCLEVGQPFCCFTTKGAVCTESRESCFKRGSYGCTDDCQCVGGQTCLMNTGDCGSSKTQKVCGGSCAEK